MAKFIDTHTIEIKAKDGSTYQVKSKKICVAVGGRPTIPTNDKIPGAEYGINSDGFFDIEEQPKRVALVGAGYIAVELAGVFNSLGTETHLIIRHDKVLRTFDPMIQDVLGPHMGESTLNSDQFQSTVTSDQLQLITRVEKTGLNVHKSSNVKKVEKTPSGSLLLEIDTMDKPLEVDVLLWAIGRHANTENLAAEKIGCELDKQGDVVVDEYQNSQVPDIYAIGDVAGKVLLTPVAIAAGRRLSNRLFGPEQYKDDKLSYENIPSVVFA